MAKVSVFAKLQENFRHIFDQLKCTECKKKIDLQAKCSSCDGFFCAECLFRSKKTKRCQSCKSIDTIQSTKNRNAFVEEVLDLIKLFDHDTGMNIVKSEFLAVETAENLDRIFDKEKASVFVQQKFIATSTPNIHNAKKVAFNSDITMIPQNVANKQLESVEKVASAKKKASSTSLSMEKQTSLNASKRKADSMTEKPENNSSRSKKAKLSEETPSEEDEIPKENRNEVNNEMETDKQHSIEKQSNITNKKNASLQETQQENNASENKNSSTISQKKIFDEQLKRLEDENKKIEEHFKHLEEINKQMKLENEQLQIKNKQFEDNTTKLRETNTNLETQLKVLEAKTGFEAESKKMFQSQLDQMNDVLSTQRMQEMLIVSLAKIMTNSEKPISSSIVIENLGKMKFTIEPFSKIESTKKDVRHFQGQTDEFKRSTCDSYVQTEELIKIESQTKTHLNYVDNEIDAIKLQGSQNFQNDIRQVVDTVIDGCRGSSQLNIDDQLPCDKSTRIVNGANKSTNNYSIQFDDESKQGEGLIAKVAGQDNKIDSDEIKKQVDNVSIFDSDEDDEVIASSPIY